MRSDERGLGLNKSVREFKRKEQVAKTKKAVLSELKSELYKAEKKYTSIVAEQQYENRELQINNVELNTAFSLLNQILSSLKFPIVVLGRNLRIKMVTPQAEKRFNIKRSAVGKSVFNIKFPVSTKRLREILDSILTTSKSYRIVVKSDKGYWYSLRVSPYKTVDDQIDGVVMVFVGIDQLKRSLERLKQSKSKLKRRELYFKSLIEESSDVVALRDSNANILYVSPSNNKIFGYKKKEFVGKNWYDFVHPDDRALAKQWFDDVASNPDQSTIVSYRFRHKDGSWRWIEGSVTNLLDDLNVNAIVVNYRDVTDRKDLEKLKDEFASISSHELRTPLANIRWKLESIMEGDFGEPSPQLKKEIHKLETENQKLINLVNKLLDVSVVQPKKNSNRTARDIEMRPLVENVISGFEKQIESKNIKVSMNVPDSMSYKGDYDLLNSVISNLTENAIKYNKDSGQIVINVRDKGRIIEIEVVDTGIGISEADKKNIFKKFYRTREASRVMSGVGLGLYSAKLHITRMGGKIDFKSSPGMGSKFKVVLPKI